MDSKALVLANFGGPRSLKEIEPFLTSLLTDQDVVRTGLPQAIHSPLFRLIASKRTKKVSGDYDQIGGRSPIYEDTEKVADVLRETLDCPVITFHRYLPATHDKFIEEVSSLNKAQIQVFPMFPQFTYATTGSLARWMDKHLPSHVTDQMRWVKSYPKHPSFIDAWVAVIEEYLAKWGLKKEEVFLLFSAHGVPKKFVRRGDPYSAECLQSYYAVMDKLDGCIGQLCFQSKFGPGEWLRPYTSDVSEQIVEWAEGRKHIVFVPISFTSDHIETLFEIEDEYMPNIGKANLNGYRVPALCHHPLWLQAISKILSSTEKTTTKELIRR